MRFFESDVFFDLSQQMGARKLLFKQFLARVALLPACLVVKLVRTAFRAVGLVWGVVLVVGSLGCSPAARSFFVERAGILSRDLVDWVLLPFSILGCFVRLVFH